MGVNDKNLEKDFSNAPYATENDSHAKRRYEENEGNRNHSRH